MYAMTTNLIKYCVTTCRFVSFLTLAMLLAMPCRAQVAVNFSILELPPTDGSTQSEARAINDQNDIVGTSYPATIDWNGTATVWSATASTKVSLGKVAKGNYSFASAINVNGRIVGDADNGSFRPNAVIYSAKGPNFLSTGFNNSHAFFVADSGFIVGNVIKGFGSDWLPTVWTEDPRKPGQFSAKFLPLMTDPTRAKTYNYAMGANNAGQVVGNVSNSVSGPRAAFWNNNPARSLTLLPNLPDQWGAYAYGINDTGVAVGTNDVGVFSTTPVVWAADANHTVAALPLFPGEFHGMATAINNGGMIIGSHGDMQLPAVWIGGRIYDLESTLDSSGADWVLDTVTDINNLGFIVGYGRKNGVKRGFMLSRVIVGPW